MKDAAVVEALDTIGISVLLSDGEAVVVPVTCNCVVEDAAVVEDASGVVSPRGRSPAAVVVEQSTKPHTSGQISPYVAFTPNSDSTERVCHQKQIGR